MAKGRRRGPRGGKMVSGKGETDKYLVEVRAGKDARAIDKKTGQYFEHCKIIHFKRPRSVVTVRCQGSRLVAHNRRQCRNKKKKFVKCR